MSHITNENSRLLSTAELGDYDCYQEAIVKDCNLNRFGVMACPLMPQLALATFLAFDMGICLTSDGINDSQGLTIGVGSSAIVLSLLILCCACFQKYKPQVKSASANAYKELNCQWDTNVVLSGMMLAVSVTLFVVTMMNCHAPASD